jgi:hypothetical protein
MALDPILIIVVETLALQQYQDQMGDADLTTDLNVKTVDYEIKKINYL